MLLREPARPAVVREHRLAPWLAVATVCFGAFMGQLDASMVTLAFPALQRQFGVALAGVQWVSLAYLLALVALLVPVGRWSDRYGRKLVYLYGFVLFTAASAACGLAPSLAVLIALRVVQAAGAAMLQANSVALVATSAPAGGGGRPWGSRPAPRRWAWRWARWRAACWSPRRAGARSSSSTSRSGWSRWRRAGSCCRAPAIAPPAGHRSAGADTAGRGRHRDAGRGVGGIRAGLPLPGLAGSAAVALLAGAGLCGGSGARPRRWLICAMLAATGTWPLLAGALCAYLVLFGPLVLIPQVLTAHGGSVVHGGAAAHRAARRVRAGRGGRRAILPARWPDRRRCLAGGLLAAAALPRWRSPPRIW